MNNSGTIQQYYANTYSFATIGSGLTDTETINYTNIVNTFNECLGRNVYPAVTQTPTPTPGLSPTQTPTPSSTPPNTPTQTRTPTQTNTASNTGTPTNTPTNTKTPTQTPSGDGFQYYVATIWNRNPSTGICTLPGIGTTVKTTVQNMVIGKFYCYRYEYEPTFDQVVQLQYKTAANPSYSWIIPNMGGVSDTCNNVSCTF
jgi:hypothetical protein